MTTTEAQKLVRQAARWVAKTYGKAWARRVKITKLNLASPWACILGQVAGSYLAAWQQHPEVVADGPFSVAFIPDEWKAGRNDVIEQAWREEIRRQRAAAK